MNSLPFGQPEREREVPEITIKDAINLLKTAKLAANRRRNYVTELVRVLNQVADGIEDKPLSCLDAPRIEWFLAQHNYCPAARAGIIGRVSTLFQFAKRRKLVTSNPCEEIEKPIQEWSPPYILSPEQAEKLMRTCQREWPERLAYLALCLFAGLRPTEARQMTWSHINSESLRVEGSISKIRQRRVVHLHPTAALWMNHCRPFSRLPFSEGLRKKWMKDFARVLEFADGWPQDCARHTCASYWLAVKPDAAYIALQLGNSPTILFRNYRELVMKEDADKFWQILP